MYIYDKYIKKKKERNKQMSHTRLIFLRLTLLKSVFLLLEDTLPGLFFYSKYHSKRDFEIESVRECIVSVNVV